MRFRRCVSSILPSTCFDSSVCSLSLHGVRSGIKWTHLEGRTKLWVPLVHVTKLLETPRTLDIAWAKLWARQQHHKHGGQFYTVPVNLPLPEKLEITSRVLANNWQRFLKTCLVKLRNSSPVERPAKSRAKQRTAGGHTSHQHWLGCVGRARWPRIRKWRSPQRPWCDTGAVREILHRRNERNEFERYIFNKRDQEANEPIDAYVSALQKLTKTCNYGQLTDSLVRDRIIVGIRDTAARKRLSQTRKLTLKQCIDIVRSFKVSEVQLKHMRVQEDRREINKKGVD